MKIGIDLDNTILNYDRAFQKAAEDLHLDLPHNANSKQSIRTFIRTDLQDELLWQKLQGRVYSRYITHYAELFPGLKRFLLRCRQRRHSVTIVSHKTEYGHFDPDRISLREAARDCLTRKGLLGENNPLVQGVFFESTREEKLQRIRSLNFDFFIDDLPEVTEALREASSPSAILFSPSAKGHGKKEHFVADSWQAIDRQIHGAWDSEEIENLAEELCGESAIAIEKIRSGGNSGSYKIVLANQNTVKLKIYPIDTSHDRIKSEFEGLRAMAVRGIHNISKPLFRDLDWGAAVYEWVEGEAIEKAKFSHIQACLNFLQQLHAIRKAEEFIDFPAASAACSSGQDIVSQVEARIAGFSEARKQHRELETYFQEEFLPTWQNLLKRARESWPQNIAFTTSLPRSEQTLSPSDFGFHNTIQTSKDSLTFFDFEYFGWDDPVKLIADFLFHPRMSLSEEQKQYWLSGAIAIYGDRILERFNAASPLYGLIWCLILLNDYRSEAWQRRLLADDSKQMKRDIILKQKLQRARELLMRIASSADRL